MTKSLTFCWLGISACIAVLLAPGCAGCQITPGPSPATGGSTGTGGAPGTGGAGTGGNVATGGTGPSEAQILCGHLDSIGCAEGKRADCPRLVELYQSDDRFTFDAGCLLLSNTPEQARKCGSVSCGGVQ
jgi:hypothetical protein